MGLLRRPTTSGIVEDARLTGLAGWLPFARIRNQLAPAPPCHISRSDPVIVPGGIGDRAHLSLRQANGVLHEAAA
jgi:hypothetical protein